MTRFVIVSHGRTGSTALCHGLNANPNVCCAYELFGEPPQKLPNSRVTLYSAGDGDSYLRNFFDQQDAHAVGFKIFTFHARRSVEESSAWRFLIEHTDIRCIFLGRRNLLASFYSEQLAKATGVWGGRPKDEGSTSVPQIWVDPRDAEIYMYRIYAEMAWARQVFAGHLSTSLLYEDLAENFEGCLRDVSTFLGVNYAPSGIVFDGRLGDRYGEFVANHAEVLNYLGTTIFSEEL